MEFYTYNSGAMYRGLGTTGRGEGGGRGGERRREIKQFRVTKKERIIEQFINQSIFYSNTQLRYNK